MTSRLPNAIRVGVCLSALRRLYMFQSICFRVSFEIGGMNGTRP